MAGVWGSGLPDGSGPKPGLGQGEKRTQVSPASLHPDLDLELEEPVYR